MDTDVVLYDGSCGLCSHAVRLIAGHDRAARFRFAALDSAVGREVLAAAGAGLARRSLPDSIVVVPAGRPALVESDAAIYVAAHLDGPLRHTAWLRVVPRPVRDLAYRALARVRYRVFGRRDACALPAPWLRERLLDAG